MMAYNVSRPIEGTEEDMTATTPDTTLPRARGDARPGHFLVGLALLAAAVAGAATAGTGVWSVAFWAVIPDVALLLAVGSTTAPGQLPRRAVPAYNLLHAPALPLVLLAVAALTWLAHIAIDRGCGYGQRTPEGWQRG